MDTSISGLFQIRLTDNLKIGYTYDAITSDSSNSNNASHEFSILLNLGGNEAAKSKRKPPFYWMKGKNADEILEIEEDKKGVE